MANLSPQARQVLESLCQNAEGCSRGEWRDVYLDNARPAGMSDKSFRSYLATLSKAGFYKPIDGYAFGEVRDEAFQVVPKEED
jgi:hypothetical protein